MTSGPNAPRAASELHASAELLRSYPVSSIALGSAIVLSMCAVCTGLGAIVGPWFVCELYSLQLAQLTGEARPRGAAWVGAAGIVLATVVVVALTGWLAALGFGPDLAMVDAADAPLPWPETLRRVALIAGSVTLAVGFIAPFLFAPLVLIDRGGRVGGAVIESAWLVASTGTLRHLALTFVVFALQLSPALIATMVVARTFERAVTPLGLLAALPLMTITIPLGQGWTIAAYLERRGLLAAPRTVRARGGPPRALVALLAFDVLGPLVALALLGVSALRPSVPAEAPAPRGAIVIERAIASSPQELTLPDGTLRVRIDGSEVRIVAGDDDGAGPLPRAWSAPIDRARVMRVRDVYAIELASGGRTFHTRVDGAGMRVDDSIRRRLEQHVPTWALFTILASFLVFGAIGGRALAPLGALRAGTALTERSEAHRTAMRWGLLLAPLTVAALYAGAVSVGWR